MLNNMTILTAVGSVLFLALIIWSMIWKGISLWKAARAGSKNWFIALLVINTLGILEILYIFVFSKKQKQCACHSHENKNLS